MMIPGTITLVSSYLLFDTIGWTNGPLPLIIPGLFGSAGNVFFMRQYFTGLPDELTEAAKLDGLSNFGTFVRIAMPLSVPVFVSLSLLSFISHYNAYLNPLIYLGDNAKYYTLQIMLKSLMSLYKISGTSFWRRVSYPSCRSLCSTFSRRNFSSRAFRCPPG